MSDPSTLSPQWRGAILWAAAIAFLFKLMLALRTFGTNDVLTYERFALYAKYFATGPYGFKPPEPGLYPSLPPLTLSLVRAMNWLSRVTPLPFPVWLRLPAILCDAGSLWLVWKLMAWKMTGGEKMSRGTALALLLMAVAPVSILVSGFHGQFDPVMIFFLLLAVWLAENDAPALAVGAAMGLSISVKLPTVIAIPAIFFYLQGTRRKAGFVAGIGAAVLLSWQPYLWRDPVLVLRVLLGYRSIYGGWGLAYLSTQLVSWVPGWAWLDHIYRAWGGLLLLGACFGLAVWMNRRPERPRLYAQCGVLFFLFLSLSNGFGVQYLAWMVPWAVGLGAFPAAVHYALGGLFAFAAYNSWSQGMPWYAAWAYEWTGTVALCQLAAWVSVVWMAWLAWERIRGDAPARTGSAMGRLVATGLAAGILLYTATDIADFQASAAEMHAQRGPAAVRIERAKMYLQLATELRQSRRLPEAVAVLDKTMELDPDLAQAYVDRGAIHVQLSEWDAAIADATHALQIQPNLIPAQITLAQAKSHTQAPPVLTIEQYLTLSMQLYAAGRYQESVEAAREALKLNPDLGEAYNDMAAAYNGLQQWDNAIEAGEQAVRLSPDVPIARNNLQWARQQKARQGR